MTDGHFGVPGNYNEVLSMQAFRGTGWTTIHLPKTTLRITANYVFMSAPRLRSLIIAADHLVTITASNALGSLSGSCKVYVPNDLVISYRKASYWSAIYTRILPIIEGPSVIYGDGTYSFIPNTPFSGFTDIEWTLEENDYLSLTTEQDGSATIVASGMTTETDVTVRLEYSFIHNGNSFTGTINIPVSYREIIQFEDEEVKRICVNNWGGKYGSAVKIPGVPGGLTMEQAAAVEQLADVFRGNTVITAFEELRFFTKIKAGGHSFRDCSKLRRVSINSTQWQFSYMVASGTTIRWNIIKMKNDGLSSSNWGTRGMGGNTVVLLREHKVYPLMENQQGTPKYYVPDDLVESYKTATNWTAYASRIYPLSEYTGEYPES